MITSNQQKLTPSSKRNPCPICGKDHGCKISDNLVLCLRGDRSFNVPGWKWVKELRNGMGGVFVPDNHTDSTFDREEWIRKQNQAKEAERKRKSSSLSEAERDRNALVLLKQLGLATRHRADLIRRGLTESQIDQIGFKTVEKFQKLILPISPDFPGLNHKGDQLKNADGYLVPLFNEFSQIIGFQIAADDRSRAKYLWLSQDSDFRLPSGEAPLTVRRVEGDPDVRLAEGSNKPLIASCRHNKSFIGAAGGNFSGSPELLKRYLDSINPERVILDCDSGVGTNRHVQQRDLANIKLVESLGYEVRIEWWGQFDKTPNNDIDEIENLTAARLLTPDEFRRILGVLSSKKERRSDKLISKEQWWEKFGLPRQEQKTESFLLNQIEKLFRFGKERKAKAKARRDKETQAIIEAIEKEVESIDSNAISYSPGNIPDLLEWRRQGEPVINFDSGDQIKSLIPEIKKGGYKFVHDRSYCGSGKTHNYGNLSLSDFGLKEFAKNEEEKKELGRVIWISENPRNPSTASVEDRYIAPLVKHGGLIEDHTRQTPNGRNHLKRSTEIEHDEVSRQELIESPSCVHWATFQVAAERGYSLRAGKNSKLCQSCDRFKICPIINSEPDQNRYLSYHPEALKTPRSNDVSIGDEARNLFKDSRSYTTYRGDIERASIHIERKAIEAEDKKTSKLVNIFIHSLLDGMDEFTPANRKHGAAHRESVEKIIFNPLIGESVEVMAVVPPGTEGATYIEDYWADPIDEGVTVRWIKPSKVSSVKEKIEVNGETIWVDSFKFRNIQSQIAFEDKIWELYGGDWVNLEDKVTNIFYLDPIHTAEVTETVSTNVWGIEKRFTTTNKEGHVGTRKVQHFSVVPSVQDIKAQLNKYLHSLDEQLFTEYQSPGEKYESVTGKVFYNWINPCLDILNGNHKSELRISNNTLVITRPYLRKASIIKNMAFHVALDASADTRDLSDLLRLKDCDSQLLALEEDLKVSHQILAGLPEDLDLAIEIKDRIASVTEAMRQLIRENKIIKIEQARPNNSNGRLFVYSNLGKVTRDRFCRNKKSGKFNLKSRYAIGNRIKALTTNAIDKALAQGKKVGILDIKAMIKGLKLDQEVFKPYEKYKDNPNVVMGWFFNDHVGSNRFADVDVLIIVGRPQINLGQLAAEFQCRTGQIVDPAHPTGEFAAYVNRVMLGELEQAIARPRIHRRPDRQIDIHLIDDYTSEELAALEKKFPGIGVHLEQVEDVCLDAATKGTQINARFDAIIKNLINLGDIAQTTAAKIGESLGVTHGRISQLVKQRWGLGFGEFKRLLISLLEPPNREINGRELTDAELWIANFYLPQIIEDWQSGHTSESEMVDDVVSVAKSVGFSTFQRILDSSPPQIVAQIVKSLFGQLSNNFLEKLRHFTYTDQGLNAIAT